MSSYDRKDSNGEDPSKGDSSETPPSQSVTQQQSPEEPQQPQATKPAATNITTPVETPAPNQQETSTVDGSQQQQEPEQKPLQQQPTQQQDDGEEAFKRAQAMALAIQNNPNLTPEEIHELVGGSQPISSISSQSSSTTHVKKSNPLASKFGNIFDNKGLASFQEKAQKALAENKGLASFQEKARKGFNDMLMKSKVDERPPPPAVVAAAAAVEEAWTTEPVEKKTTAAVPSSSETNEEVKIKSDKNTTTTSSASSQPQKVSSLAEKVTGPVVNAATKLAAPVADTTNKVTAPVFETATKIGAPVHNATSAVIHTATKVVAPIVETASEAATDTAKKTAIITSSSSFDENNTTITSPTSTKKSLSVDTSKKLKSPKPMKSPLTRTMGAIKLKVPSSRGATWSEAPLTESGSEDPSYSAGESTSTKEQLHLQEETTFTSSAPPVRLTGVCWKRRGGLGKYSLDAWERRRIELQGTKLLYYTNEIIDNDAGELDSPNNLSTPGSVTSEPSQQKKPTGWFDNLATFNTLISGNTETTTTEEKIPSKARGYVDIAKEKAAVHSSMGHSGAPSPFALSIVVKGETKWKLCFDQHKEQMEWLAAISDIVVQTSVDAYNQQLLDAANPTNAPLYPTVVDGVTSSFVRPPPAPPLSSATKDTSDGGGSAGRMNRLWMMESYDLSSRNWGDGTLGKEKKQKELSDVRKDATKTLDKKDVVVVEASDFEDSDAEPPDHSAVRELAVGSAKKTWSVPEKHLRTVMFVLNFSLFYARASSTSLNGFWYLVVISNMVVFFCMVKEPDWRSILEHVRAADPVISKKIIQKSDAMESKEPTKQQQLKGQGEGVAVARKTTKTKFKPKAGQTTVRVVNETDPPVNDKNEMFAGWRPISGEIIKVRSHGYLSTKAKINSPGSLYEIARVEIFESPKRYPDMALRVQLPEVKFEGEDENTVKTWRCPDVFVISIALPTDPPKLTGSSSDGGGYTITLYFTMTQKTRDILKRVTAEGYDPTQEKPSDPQKSTVNAVRLLEEWVRRSPSDPKFQARFKVVPYAHNLKEIGMPAWISKYNNKPFLIKRANVTGFLFVHPELSTVEFDISLHPFPYLAKQGICFMKDSYFKKVLVTFGFVIEGRSDDELPECLLGLVQLCYPDPAYAIQAADFFSGKAPKSFE